MGWRGNRSPLKSGRNDCEADEKNGQERKMVEKSMDSLKIERKYVRKIELDVSRWIRK